MIRRPRALFARSALLLVLAFTLNPFLLSQGKPGIISGEIRDASTQQPLPAATILLVGTSFGAVSDSGGRFAIRDVPPGAYIARVSFVGYRTVSVTDILVSQARNTSVQVDMQPTEVQAGEVVVTGGYFQKPLENPVSLRSLTAQEIRRSPGSAEDIFRVMQSMPGVATAGGKSAQLIVRGGSPDENLTLLDHVEIYNPIHFARTGESMGIISIVNPSLLRSVDFLTGGFPAQYGDKMSSVFNMTLVDGNKERTNFDLNANVAGFGALVDGPVIGDGSMVFSARRGFFDLLTSLLNKPAAPQYYDAVGKVTYDLGASNRVSLVGFSYLDKITRTGATKESSTLSKFSNVNRDDDGSAVGMNWRALISPRIVALTTLSFTSNGWNTLQGTSADPALSGEDIRENEYGVKNETILEVSPSLEIKGGFQVHGIDSRHTAWAPADTTRRGEIVPASSIAYNPPLSTKTALFLQDTWRPIPTLVLTTGIRVDAFSFNRETNWSPRFGLTYHVTDLLAINASYGSFTQTPAAYQIALDPLNQKLTSSRAIHSVAGIEYLLQEDILATIEVYRKDLTAVIVGNDTTNILTNAGSGTAQGIEFSIQKKYTNGLVGSASYSWSRSQRQDGAGLPVYDFEYDRPHIVNLILGWEAGDNWQIGVKWQFASGNPYTPPVGVVRKNGAFYVVDGPTNSARYPDYHKLDLRIDRKFVFESFTLTAYLDLWNVYNRTNVLSYTYSADPSGTITQKERLDFGLLPIVGLSMQF